MRFYDQQNVLVMKNSRPFYGDIKHIYNANRGPGTRKGICYIDNSKVPVYQSSPNSVWLVESLSTRPVKKVATGVVPSINYARSFVG